jgi:hypothetical protein
LWPALAGVGLMFGVSTLQAGSGTIQGVAKSGCVVDYEMSLKSYMLAEALDAKNGMVVATATVNYDDDSFAIGPLPEGQYRLCFQFSLGGITPPTFYPYARSFYREEDSPTDPGQKPHYVVRCFEEGTLINVADGVTSAVSAYIGWNCGTELVYMPPQPQGSVTDGDGIGLEGIVVEVLGACSASVVGRAVTDASGTFVEYNFGTLSEDEWYKIRLSDPAGRYRSSFYGATEDDFAAGTTEWNTPITAMMLPARPDIEVAPLVADFGNVELPGSGTTVVTIQNIGGSDLEISALTLVAGSSPYVSIKSAPALPLTLAADASCEVTLEFEPRTLGPAAATLAVVSDDPDEATVLVSLNGQGVASSAPPAEQVATTLEFYEESAAEGTLQGTGPAGSGDAHLEALLNQIKAASDLAAAGKLDAACKQLENALKRTDGDPQPPDFVTGPAAAELRLLIELTRLAMGCK